MGTHSSEQQPRPACRVPCGGLGAAPGQCGARHGHVQYLVTHAHMMDSLDIFTINILDRCLTTHFNQKGKFINLPKGSKSQPKLKTAEKKTGKTPYEIPCIEVYLSPSLVSN